MEGLLLIGLFISGCALTYLIIAIYEKFHLRFIDNTSHMYYERINYEQKAPLKFKYKGHDITIDVSRKSFDKGISCYDIERITYIINNKEVACLSKMEVVMTTKRFMYLNSDYDTSEFYKILRAARKSYSKKWNENWNKKYDSADYKLY